MPYADPVSLTAAIVAAAIGAALGLFVVARYVSDLRLRRRLLSEAPDFSSFDRDIQRYLKRVWLAVASWRDDVSARDEVDLLWSDAFAGAQQLQERRKSGEEVAAQVSELVEKEAQIESRISELRPKP